MFGFPFVYDVYVFGCFKNGISLGGVSLFVPLGGALCGTQRLLKLH